MPRPLLLRSPILRFPLPPFPPSSVRPSRRLKRAHLTASVVLLTLALVPPPPAPALARSDAPLPSAFEPLDLDRGATGLGLALRRAGNTARVLYVTAHPDDEHNGILVRLSRGLGVRTALLTLTRGEGGQNAIGPELFDALGILRMGELMALHRSDAVEQYFGRAFEFGYSFSVEETFAKWGREETLGDVVRVVRAFRPEVIVTLPLQGKGGGQHHHAAALLAKDAFRVAADPARFPEQGLPAWQARKIYEGGIGGFGGDETAAVRVPTGVYDTLLGLTWQQLGMRSRTLHRSQGMGQLGVDPGPAEGRFRLVDSEPTVTGSEADILDGVDATVLGLARFAPDSPTLRTALTSLGASLSAAAAAYRPDTPIASVPALASALLAVRAARAELSAIVPDASARAEIEDRLEDEAADLESALMLAHGLVLEARADDGLVTPGQSLGVAVALFNNATGPVEVEALELQAPPGWAAQRREASETGPLAGAASRRARFTVTAAPDARPTQPYWRRLPDLDRHELLVAADETLPWSPPAVTALARLRVGGAPISVRVPVVWRYEGPFVGGERQHELTVVPELSLRLTPEVAAIPLVGARKTLEVRASVRSFSKSAAPAELRLEAPDGFTVEPPSVRLDFAVEGEEAVARFRVTPPSALRAGTLALRAVATREGREHRDTVQAVEYDHLERRQLLRPAETRLVVLDVRTRPGVAVGYVMGSGDALADAIRQLGVPLTLLGEDDLLFADLGRFTTIVVGIRAYETRADLRSSHGRLMRWVEAGGHLVVQYGRAAMNRLAPAAPPPAEGAPSPFVPFPASVTPERVTDETAAITLLAPEHPLLTTPNRITADDWSGWVQERGIQLLSQKDPRYLELLAASDPFPYNAGEKRGLLVDAAVGKGSWTYVGLVLFRQVPAGVPGAWRLLANLVSRPRGSQPAR